MSCLSALPILANLPGTTGFSRQRSNIDRENWRETDAVGIGRLESLAATERFARSVSVQSMLPASRTPIIFATFAGAKKSAGEIVPAFIWTNASMAA